MLENTARDPLARAKLVAVDNGKIKYKKKTCPDKTCM
jgi:ribosomal protein S27AE